MTIATWLSVWSPVLVLTSPAAGVTFTHQLLAAGYTSDELARLSRTGELVHLRRGAYAWASGEAVTAAEGHRRLVSATVPMLARGTVVSHTSAAVLHGLPVRTDRLTRVEVTRATATSGKCRGGVHLHTAPLEASEVVMVGGVPVTSLARTVIDLGRSLPFEQAVSVADAALRVGCARDELDRVLTRATGWRGAPAARREVAFCDGLSESPGESLSRVTLAGLGLPKPVLQYEVHDDDGVLVGRSDFAWEAERTLGEFDGKVKYGALLKPGQSTSDVVYAEKRREDALRSLGWEVVRWSWDDLRNAPALADRLLRAFARGLARAGDRDRPAGPRPAPLVRPLLGRAPAAAAASPQWGAHHRQEG